LFVFGCNDEQVKYQSTSKTDPKWNQVNTSSPDPGEEEEWKKKIAPHMNAAKKTGIIPE